MANDPQPQWAAEAKPGPYVTPLSQQDEGRFQDWVKQNKVPWQDSPTADYDMRGFWKAQQAGDPNAKRAANLHFPDTWKTPYHQTFSNESKYALPTAGHWQGDRFIPPQTQSISGTQTVESMAAAIKQKYPDYAQVDPHKLVSSVIQKYPVYQTHLSTDELQRLTAAGSPEPSLGQKASALGGKFVDALSAPGTSGAAQMEFQQKHPVASALLGPIGSTIASGAVMKPTLDIQKLEAPGYAEEHPFMHGVAAGTSGLTSPFVAGTMGLGGAAEAAAPRVSAWATRVFTAQMAMGNVRQAEEFRKAYARGDKAAAMEAAGEFASTFPFTALGVAAEGPRKASGAAEPQKAPEPTLGASAASTTRLSEPEVPQAQPVEKNAPTTSLRELFKPAWQKEAEAAYKASEPAVEALRAKVAENEAIVAKEQAAKVEIGRDLVDPNDYSKGYKTPAVPAVKPAPPQGTSTGQMLLGGRGVIEPLGNQAEIADLREKIAALKPADTRSPMDKVRAAVDQTVTPQAVEKMDPAKYRANREEVLGRVIDAHAEDGRITPADLRAEATANQTKADSLQYIQDVQGAKTQLQAARKEAGVQRIRVESYQEPGEGAQVEGQDRTKPGFGFVDTATTARRTVLDMLGGYRLSFKRLYEPETGKVERNFKTTPLTPEESRFAMEQQSQLAGKIKTAQDSREFPTETMLADMEKHVTAVEAATGMKMVYAGKGESGFDPSARAINEILGRGQNSKLTVTPEAIERERGRYADAADLLRSHADRLEGISPEAPKPVEAKPAVAPTPVSTPSEVAPEVSDNRRRISEIDQELQNLRDTFQDAQAAERAGGMPVSKETVQAIIKRTTELRAEKDLLSQKGAINANLLGGSVGVRLRDWFDANREDTTTIPGKLQDVADRVKFGLGQLSSHMAKFTAALKGTVAYQDFDKVTGDFDVHMQQTAEIREEFDKGLKQLVPDKIKRIAITNYIEAGGDPAVLASREASSKDRFKQGYKLAQNLSPLEKAAADSLRLSYDDLAHRAQAAGVLHSTLADYVNHVYKQLPPQVGRALQSISSGTLRSNPGFAMRRVWDSFYEAEQNGAIPEKDIGWLHSHYVDAMERAIASRAYVRNGTESLEADGRKTFSVSGSARQIGETEQDPALLVRPHGSGVNSEDDVRGYRQINHSSMRRWQWTAKDPVSGTNVFMQGDLLVHPDRYAEVKAMLESSRLRDSGLAKFALKTTAAIKNSIFLMTGFHPLTLSFHGAERGAWAGKLDKLDVQNNQVQQVGVSHGLKLNDYDAAYTFGKSIEETNLFASIPGFGKFVQGYQHWVFNDLQPRLKVTAYRLGLEANLKTYGSSLSHDQIAAKTAVEVNNAFGGQNWQRMGVSKTAQDVLKLGFMAPDFLKSRMAYTAQSFRPDIHLEQTKSMWLRGGLAMYTVARVLNHVLDHDPHWDARDAFTVYSGGQKYTLRTAQQDFVGLLQNPHSFMTARVAPLGQTAVEGYTGRNEQGFERTGMQQVQDLLARTPQLTVQQYLNSPDASWWDSFRSSMGIHVHEAHTEAEDLALQFRAQAIPRGEQGDEERDRLKTLRGLRRLGTRGRTEEFERVLSDGMERGVLAEGDADKLYDNLGAEYLPQLVKGLDATHAFEVFRKASPDERGAIQDIVEDKFDRAMDSDAISQKVKDRMSREADELFK